jgi:hypothetical protein
MLEGAHAEHMVEGGFARAQRVKQISPGPPDAFLALHERQRTQGAGRVGTQQSAKRRELENPLL